MNILIQGLALLGMAAVGWGAEPQPPPAPETCIFEPDYPLLRAGSTMRMDEQSWKANPALAVGQKIHVGQVDGAAVRIEIRSCSHFNVSVAVLFATEDPTAERETFARVLANLNLPDQPPPLSSAEWQQLLSAGELALRRRDVIQELTFVGNGMVRVAALSYTLNG